MGRTAKDRNNNTKEFFESKINEWRKVFDSITDMVSVLDTDYRIIRVNKPLANYLGVEPRGLIGKKCYKVMHGTEKPSSYCPIADSSFNKKPLHKEVYDSVLDKHFMLSLSPILDEKANVQCIVHVMRDITDSKHREEALQKREKQLTESQHVAKLGSWEWNIKRNILLWSDELYTLFGTNPLEFEPSYELFLSMVHPDDRGRLDSAVKESIEIHKPYRIDVRILRSDGSEWIMEARGIVTYDKNGFPEKMAGTAQDITQRKRVESDLVESEEKYRKLIETSNDAILLADSESGIIIDANKQAEKLFGYPLDKIIGMHQTDLHPEKEIENYRNIFKKHVRKKSSFISDLLVVHKSGRKIPVDISASQIELGSKIILQGVFRDITDRKKTEAALKTSEEKYRSLFSSEQNAIIMVEPEKTRIVDANDSALRQYGYSREEMLNLTGPDLSAEPEQSKAAIEKMVKSTGKHIHYHTRYHKKKDGSVFPVEISSGTFMLKDKKIISAIIRDITDRKKAEDDLIIKNRAIESSLSAIGITDSDGNLLYVNDSLLQMWGYDNKNEVLGRGLNEFWEGTRIYKTIENTLKMGGDIGEDRGKRKDGSVFDVQFSSSLIKDKDGLPQYFFGSFLDISEQKKAEEELKKYHTGLESRVQERTLEIKRTNEKLLKQISDRKEAEEALRESEMRFRVAATTMTDLIWDGDVRDNSLNWHGDIDQYLGYEEGEFPRTISGHMESIHDDDMELFIKQVEEALETGNEFRSEYRIRCKDGSCRYWTETGKAVEYEGGKAVKWIGSVSDITDRKKVEEQILKSEEQFKKLSKEFNALLDAIPDNIILLDSDLKILWANRASMTMFNKNSPEMDGKHCYRLCCDNSAPCKSCPVIACFNSGNEETARIISPADITWDIRAFPVKDEAGNVKNVIEVARDVSVRVKLEKEKGAMQARLIHTNKMMSLGTLISGVAHEINNPNSFIMTNADIFNDIWKDVYNMLKQQNSKNDNVQFGGIPFSELDTVVPKLLRGIYAGSGRIKNIVDNLKDFAGPDRSEQFVKVDVNKAVRAASSILDFHIKQYTDHYYLSCRDNIPFINGNSQQIEQVVINLIINSLQALPDRESCVIVSTYYDNENGLVIIKVEDEGTGISESDIDRITEPFFTTRIESGGSGLGLSISYSIIKEHQGTLEFMSEKNRKTVALIKLPVCFDARND